MLSRRVNRLISKGMDLLKCNVHDLRRVSDVNTKEAVGEHLKVQGWVHAIRKMKNVIFLDVTDGSTNNMLQIVLSKDNKPKDLEFGCSIVAEGTTELAPNGRIELHTEKIHVLGSCKQDQKYPFLPRVQHPTEYCRDFLHFRPRTRSFSATLRLRDLASNAIRDHFRSRHFINVDTPVLTSNDCENAGEVFYVMPESKELLKSMHRENVSDEELYFSNKAYLTVSGQLHLEIVARALTKVYSFGPTFRAENKRSRLHLSEFHMIEAEIAFLTELEQLMEEIECLIKSSTKEIVEKGACDLQTLESDEPQWLDKKFGCMTYEEAINVLQSNKDRITTPVRDGELFAKEHEFFLVEHNGGVPLFIINWPKNRKPFYMKECVDDSSKVAALDLLVPGVGELVGGSLREDNYKKLEEKLPSNNMTWYLELRGYGNVTTGGFGMGFERYLQFILGIQNIKDAIPFPRWPHNCFL